MKNKLIFRVLGALTSSLIILSVFVPFSNLAMLSLWDQYSNLNQIYLPIMIIVFGSIGVIFFALNIKTEFAYLSSGANLFFSIIQLLTALNNNQFSNLGLGFYFLIIGSFFTGIMAFMCNLNSKSKKKEVVTSIEPKINIQDQIENLYNNSSETSLQNYNSIPEISPVSAQFGENQQQIKFENPTVSNQDLQPIQLSNVSTPPMNPALNLQPIQQTTSAVGNPTLNLQPMQQTASAVENPTLNLQPMQQTASVVENPTSNLQQSNQNPTIVKQNSQIGQPYFNLPRDNKEIEDSINSIPGFNPQSNLQNNSQLSNPSINSQTQNNSNMGGLDIFGNF